MTWAFLDDHADENPKLLAVGAEAAWYYACGLCYCRRSEGNGAPGFIPSGKAFVLCTVKNARKVVGLLVAARLWEEAPGGFQVHDYGKVYAPKAGDPERDPSDLSAKRAEAGRLGGLRSAASRKSKQGTAQPKQSPEANQKQSASKQTRSNPKQNVPEARACLDPRARGSDSGSGSRSDTTNQDPTGHSGETVGAVVAEAVRTGRIPCPRDLSLTADERANVEMAGVPSWAIDVLVPTCRAKLLSGDARALDQWSRSLVSAVVAHWNDPKRRPRRPDAQRPDDDTEALFDVEARA